jgi:hypothetical protein
MKNKVEITSIVSWAIPFFGNSHFLPYGTLRVTDGVTTKNCQTKGDRLGDHDGYQYITFKRKRYKVINSGTLHFPMLSLKEVL